ncbi:AbgT family transporter, partial [Cetobacterium sp.]
MEKGNERKKHGILDWIERVGNKIPHPFMLFFFLSVFIIVLSWVLNYFGIEVVDPVKNEVVKVKNLLSSE